MNFCAPALGVGERWEQLDLDAANACGRTSLGRLVCWGGGASGSYLAPAGAGYRSFDLLGDYLCAVDGRTQVFCYARSSEPLQWSAWHHSLPGDGFVDVVTRGYDVCGLRQDGTVRCNVPYYR